MALAHGELCLILSVHDNEPIELKEKLAKFLYAKNQRHSNQLEITKEQIFYQQKSSYCRIVLQSS